MNVAIHLITYLSLLIFLAAIAIRILRIRGYPLNLRWEIYPIPHEGKRSAYGGSKMEAVDYWAKPHKPDKIAELKFMLAEMIFIKALFEHNRNLWYRSFPFHFGLYLLAAFVGLLTVGAVLQLAGMPFAGPEVSSLVVALNTLTAVVGVLGFLLAIVGAVGLLRMRLTDDDLKPYTNFSHVFNLLFLLVTLTLAAAAFALRQHLTPYREYLAGLIAFDLRAPTGGPLTALSILAVSLLVAYIPLTHMSHFFVKWFTWHTIRWDDRPNVRGGRIEKMIEQALQYPVSWSADHIQGDGKKTWADVATEELPKRG
jgi:nitrate reductase gamma subunit